MVATAVAGLALAGPAGAQLVATQSQSGSNGVVQAVATNAQVTANTVQAPVAVNAPVRVLSPGDDAGGGTARASAGGADSGGGSTNQSQSGRDGAAQLGVTNVQVAGTRVQAPVAVVMPIRVLGPGADRGEASATAAGAEGGGSAEQSQTGDNGALQALLTSLQVAGTSVQTSIAVYAPVRVLSPGDGGGDATASADAGGGGGSAEQSQNGANGALQAGVTNLQLADNAVQAPIGVYAPVRVLSPGDDGGGASASAEPGGAGGGSADQSQNGANGALQAGVTNAQVADTAARAPVAVTAPVRVLSPGSTATSPGGDSPGSEGEGPGNGASGSGGGELGTGAGGTGSESVVEVLAAAAGGGGLPFTGAPVGLLALLGAGLFVGGMRLRAAGTESGR
ncbi:MAG: hypothetical protein ACRDMU_03670 [Gaiellaceae bacterium]